MAAPVRNLRDAYLVPCEKSQPKQESGKENGVDDGFRTRDLRIHNPAL